jgi:DNA-binding CsgD family transcriptional regulator
MNVIHTLNEKLLTQNFDGEPAGPMKLSHYQYMAYMYSLVENAIAVLSDMKTSKSYIYKGKVARELGLDENHVAEEIGSIWEEDIFNKIHVDDLLGKHLLELQFFNLLKGLPVSERSDYHVKSKIRMLAKSGKYLFAEHRMFYISSGSNGNLWLALCLYNLSCDDPGTETPGGLIVNSVNGSALKPTAQDCNNLLSSREKEILQLIHKGKMSKEIAAFLSISIHTVNRHRQNILEKLRVSNSLEACRIAEKLQLI